MSSVDRSIRGRCLACDGRTLFRGDGGYLTCSWIECPNPGATGEFLEQGIDYEAMLSYLHATIYSARREDAMLDRDQIKWIVQQLIALGIGRDHGS